MDPVTGSFLVAAAIVGVGYGVAEWHMRRSLQREVERLRRMAAEAERLAAGLRQVRDILGGALGELRSAEARLKTRVEFAARLTDPSSAKRIADEALRNANRSSRRA